MQITDEQRNRWKSNKETWIKRAKNDIKTLEQLNTFTNELVEYCQTLPEPDYYEETVNATTAISLAAARMFTYKFGLTVFQTGAVMWGIIDNTITEDHDVGMKMLNFNNMLYPQYEHRFEKSIPPEVWHTIQKRAKELIEENEKSDFKAHKNVVAHWKSIVDGKIPFGFIVKEEK